MITPPRLTPVPGQRPTYNGNFRKEKPLVVKIVKWINQQPGCWAMKRPDGINNRSRGMADVSGTIWGVRLEIEVKVGRNTPTNNQRKWLKKRYENGCITGVCWCLEDVYDLLVPILQGPLPVVMSKLVEHGFKDAWEQVEKLEEAAKNDYARKKAG